MVSEQGLQVEEVLSVNGFSMQQTKKQDRNKRTNQYFTFKTKNTEQRFSMHYDERRTESLFLCIV